MTNPNEKTALVFLATLATDVARLHRSQLLLGKILFELFPDYPVAQKAALMDELEQSRLISEKLAEYTVQSMITSRT
ncbi:MAG: hypothetical protein SGJ20_07015 [Planctomycetota bacterium]|nr:hypothetical protein [Planctomycetota bacterium]